MINGHVSRWWHHIGVPPARAELPGSVDVDVAIVGAGFTGLWTAYALLEHDSTLRVAVIEQQHVGFGASGRNGGWLTNSITGGKRQYVASHGRDAAERFQRAMNDTVAEVQRVAEVEQIDADILSGGELHVATNEAQAGRLRRHVEAEQAWKYTDLELLDRDAAMAKVGVAPTVVAAWHPHAARIQPAKLVRGLADAVERRGATIYERTRVTKIEPGCAHTTHGDVRAEFVVRATEGFTANLPGVHRQWLPMNSSIIATEPLPSSVWDELHWSKGEVMGDSAHAYMYAQRTADDRIAIGGRGVPYRFGSRTDTNGDTAERTVDELSRILHTLFPQTHDARIDHVWSGVLGVPRDWSPTVTFDRDSGLAWAGGYVGTGVTATNLAGRTLADLLLGRDTEIAGLPWVNHRVRTWEIEPLRWLATRALYGAYRFADRAEARGRSQTHPIAKIADVVSGRGK